MATLSYTMDDDLARHCAELADPDMGQFGISLYVREAGTVLFTVTVTFPLCLRLLNPSLTCSQLHLHRHPSLISPAALHDRRAPEQRGNIAILCADGHDQPELRAGIHPSTAAIPGRHGMLPSELKPELFRGGVGDRADSGAMGVFLAHVCPLSL